MITSTSRYPKVRQSSFENSMAWKFGGAHVATGVLHKSRTMPVELQIGIFSLLFVQDFCYRKSYSFCATVSTRPLRCQVKPILEFIWLMVVEPSGAVACIS